MSPQALPVVFGTAPFGNYPPFNTAEAVKEALAVLEKHGVKTLDSAQLYGESEATLGAVKAGDRFTLDTKWLGGWQEAWATRDNIVKTAKESIEKLGVKQVDIFYIHSPDDKVDLGETLAAVDEVYKLGLFKRFGLSNYKAASVQKVYDLAKEKGYVLPTVYQGNYSAVARRQETELFPTLRKLGIAFYAYSPLAGGFLTKTAQQITDGIGRFSGEVMGGLYKNLYNRPSYLTALEKWAAVAEAENTTRAELAYRWVAYNSPLSNEFGDAIIVGASSVQQIEQTLAGIEKGPLSDKAVQAIDQIWEDVKHEAPLDNFSL